MKRPTGSAPICFEVMIPARNEAERLPDLIPNLVAGGCRVTVFDDESADGTGEIASRLGAHVVQPHEPLPSGWRGKTRACHALSAHALSGHAEPEWVVFLDADTRPSPAFAAQFSAFLAGLDPAIQVVTGFPKMLPGQGLEPGYLFWVPWILLATNPFGLVSRTKMGHNFFLNGQITAWRRLTLAELQPFEAVKNEVLEDVKLGRILAGKKVPVEVANLSHILSVQMYRDIAEASAGMSKNTADVIPGRLGPALLAIIFAALALGWLLVPPVGVLLLASGLAVDLVVQMPFWVILTLPVSLLAGGATAIRSAYLRKRGTIEWKGRRL